MQFDKTKYFRLFVLGVLLLCACDESDYEVNITFIGDSLISRWDLEYYFPTYAIQNCGLAGSGIKWLEENWQKLNGQTAVVLTGTNDLKKIDEASLDSYACQYVDAIVGLDAKKVLLISLLPRNRDNDPKNVNVLISNLNQLIADKIKDESGIIYCDVYSEFIKNGTLNMNLSYDGVHLNQYGYEILASTIKRHL